MFNLTGQKLVDAALSFGGVLKAGWKQFVSADLLLYSKLSAPSFAMLNK